jgi:hypothetical protein
MLVNVGRIVVVHCLLLVCEREVMCVREFSYCKIFRWV